MKRILFLMLMWFVAGAGAEAANPWPATCIQPIAVGQTISGTLSESGCAITYAEAPDDLYYTVVYSFEGTAGQQVAISMSSGAVDAWLELYNVNDVDAEQLAFDDNGGGGTNARIPAGNAFFTLPTTGTYYVWANTAFAAQTGAFTITVTTPL